MASYCTPQVLLNSFEEQDLLQLTNLRDPNASEIRSERLEQYCRSATGIINGYLMRKFTVPLENPSAELLQTLEAHAIILARELMGNTSEEDRAKAEATRAWLSEFTDPASGSSLDKTPGADPIAGIAFEIAPQTWTTDSLNTLF